jgi:hypothetical protein
MEESRKKPIMIAVIVVCLGVAAFITFRGRGGGDGLDDIPDDAMVWVKCNNPSCNAEYEMNEKEYYRQMKEQPFDPDAPSAPPLTCEKCGKPSLYLAMKCGNPACGIVFFKGAAGSNDFPDRCPKCRISKMEEERKRRLQEGGG